MLTLLLLVNAAAVAAVALRLGPVLLMVLVMATDDCDADDWRLLCTGIPTMISIGVLLSAFVGAIGVAVAPLVVDGTPDAWWSWPVLLGGMVGSVGLTLVLGHIPVRRPCRRRD